MQIFVSNSIKNYLFLQESTIVAIWLHILQQKNICFTFACDKQFPMRVLCHYRIETNTINKS